MYMRYKFSKETKKQITKQFVPVSIKKEAAPAVPSFQIIIENYKGMKMHVPSTIGEERLLKLLALLGSNYA